MTNAVPFPVNSLWFDDAMLRHISSSTLALLIAGCLMAPRYFLNQCWNIIKWVMWHSCERDFAKSAHEVNPWHLLTNSIFKIATSFMSQWVLWGKNFVRQDTAILHIYNFRNISIMIIICACMIQRLSRHIKAEPCILYVGLIRQFYTSLRCGFSKLNLNWVAVLLIWLVGELIIVMGSIIANELARLG